MKRYNIFAWLSGLLLCACAEHDSLQDQQNGGNTMELQAEISQQYITRANDGGFADGDQIGVFIVNYQNNEPQALRPTGNHADNVRFTYDETTGKWTGSYQLYWKDKTTPIDAYGYYPFDAELSEKVQSLPTEGAAEGGLLYAFSVLQNQRDNLKTGRKLLGYEASDFLWAKEGGVSPTAGAITLQHHHMMAGVKIILKEGDFFDEGEWNTLEKTVLVENTITESTINLQTGQVSCLSGSSAKTITPLPTSSEAAGDASFRAVVVPQTVAAENILYSITVGGKSYQFKRQEPIEYYPGKLHQFTFEVQKSQETGDYQFNLISESITPWDNDPESHNGQAHEYITVNITEGQFLGDAIDSLGIDPANIVNLKLTGTLSGRDGWLGGDLADENFIYMRNNMPLLEAINMKELRTKRMRSYMAYWNDSWSETHDEYNQPLWGDDYIPCNAFLDKKTLAYVTWPDSLKGIGDQAFAGARLRGSVILPEGLKHIGGGAFVSYGHNVTMLTGELYIPSTVEFIGGGAFGAHDGVKAVYFQNELILPEHLVYLGDAAFTGCAYMTGTVRIPDGLDVMNCAWPDQIGGPAIIPQGVKRINGVGRGITSVYIPEGVEEIGERAFFECTKLTGKVHIPSTVKKIGREAFYSEWNSVPITHVDLPEGLEIIEERTFQNCAYLQDTIVIPSTVKQIRGNAFENCRMLSAVILPAGLEGILDGAFAGCYSLDYIRCLGSTPPAIKDYSFSGVEKDNFTVVVPEGAVEAYKNADGWREFKRIAAYRNFVCRPMKAKLLNKSNVRDIVLNADEAWTVKECPSWVHLDKTSGNKKTELKATIDALPHGSGDREGNVVFQLNRNNEEGKPITCTFQVQQYDYEIDEDATITLQTATQGQRGGIDIVFVGDGYDAEDIARGTYRTHMEQEMEYFFGVEPFKTYRNYFNVHAAMAMSYESGVVDSPDKWRNTKFGITYGADDNGRLLVDFDNIAGYVLYNITDGPITDSNFGRSLVICVPNSDAYEGLTCMYGDGSAIAVCPHSTWDYPHDARGLVQHEAGGHGWGKLDDEYIYHRALIQTCTCTCCSHVEGVLEMHAMGWGRNLSLDGKYKNVPWSHLIFDKRYGDIVDIYEGGHMHSDGIFRSEYNSCMNNNVPYFSTWSRQLMVERIMWAAGETFDYETFVSKDSREMGDKFLTRSTLDTPWQQVKAYHSEDHGPVIRKGRPKDYLKK